MILTISIAVVSASVTFLIGWLLAKSASRSKYSILTKSTEEILSEAREEGEILKKEKALEAKDEWYRQKEKYETTAQKKKADLIKQEQKLKEEETAVTARHDSLKTRENDFNLREKAMAVKEKTIEEKMTEVELLIKRENETLEHIAGLSEGEARQKLFDNLIDDVQKKSAATFNEIKEHAKLHAFQESRRILVSSIQRTAVELARETTVTVVDLPSDDIKGRIIGRDGRNIRAFENVTGVEVIVDDTPLKVTLSAFDPYRREIARQTLEKLLADGRIHPARIEEVVEKVREDMSEYALELGNQAVVDTGIHGVHTEIIRLVGMLRFRNVLGHNAMKHSLEVANLAGLLAAELDMDARLLKRAGLLHDIGLAVRGAVEQDHADIGADIARKYKEPEAVVNAIRYHDNRENTTDLAGQILYIADQISQSRPGVRSEDLGRYVKRLSSIEEIALARPGVEKAFAIQAGREVRVIVQYSEVPDDQMQTLADDIANRIETELRYPGQIKVIVIREFRSIDVAK